VGGIEQEGANRDARGKVERLSERKKEVGKEDEKRERERERERERIKVWQALAAAVVDSRVAKSHLFIIVLQPPVSRSSGKNKSRNSRSNFALTPASFIHSLSAMM